MNFLKIFISGFLIFIFCGGFFLVYDYSFEREIIQSQKEAHLEYILQFNLENQGIFLNETEREAFFLSNSEAVKEIFYSQDNLEDNLDELKLFMQNRSYENLILIKKDEGVIWNFLDKNISMDFFKKVQSTLEAEIFDYFLPEKNYSETFIVAPVFNEENLIGFIALQIDKEKINKLIIFPQEFYLGEVYIINKNLENITPLKYEQGFESSNGFFPSEKNFFNLINSCFEEQNNSVSNVYRYKNYAGIFVNGIHGSFLNPRWCILIEFREKSLFNSILNEISFRKIFVGFLLFIFVVGVFFCSFLDNHFRLNKLKIKEKKL